MTWSTALDLKQQVMKWWGRGELLACLVTGETIFPRRLKLKGPTSNEMIDCYDAVRSWIASLRGLRHYRLEMREINHRVFGKNMIPSEIWVDSLEDAASLIGKQGDVKKFLRLLKLTKQARPELLSWVANKPLRALEHYGCWEHILNVVAWLTEHPRPGIYLRQVDAVGVDSKFIESHRQILAELFDLVLPDDAIEKEAIGAGEFIWRYGFKDKPLRIRFRILDDESRLFPWGGEQDITLDQPTFSQLQPDIENVFITENEINFLSFGCLKKSMVIFGAGYGIGELSTARWLHDCRLYYWGDIDTHGLAILNSARSYFPQIKSLLMDEHTLLRFISLSVAEPSQHAAEELSNLDGNEQSMYRRLKLQIWGKNIRLEQERISWSYAWEAVTRCVTANHALEVTTRARED